MNYDRTARVSFQNKGKQVSFDLDDSMDLKFEVQYSLAQMFGGATVSICGMSSDFVSEMIKVFEQGIAYQKQEFVDIVVEAGYKNGTSPKLGKIYQGKVFANKISMGPDYWLTMQCFAQGVNCATKAWSITSPMKFKDACKNYCAEMLGEDKGFLYLVEDKELESLEIKNFTVGNDPRRQYGSIFRQIQAWSKGKVTCIWEDRLGDKGSVVVIDTAHYTQGVATMLDKLSQQSKVRQYSFIGTEGKEIAYGLPKLFIPGIELDVQLDHTIVRGVKFNVESNIFKSLGGLEYYVVGYTHKGHLRGDEWITHIKGQLTNINAYKSW